MKPNIVVVGSANIDFVMLLDELPTRAETVLGGKFFTTRGGKGANQAVAAARLGGEVTFVARLGEDSMGREAAEAYRSEGIHIDHLALEPQEPTGVAMILVNKKGENYLAVASGANGRLSPEDVRAAGEAICQADCVLLQLEVPLQTVQAAAGLAHRYGKRVILNPAPAPPLPQDLLRQVDILTPNEVEARMLAGEASFTTPEEIAASLAEKSGIATIILTLGVQGSLVWSGGQITRVPAFPVTAVDSTAAGDAFNGALAVALGRGDPLLAAVRYANAAGGLSTTRAGAQPSLPTKTEIDQFLRDNPPTGP